METNRKPEIKGKRKWNVKPEKWVVGREEGGIKGKLHSGEEWVGEERQQEGNGTG